MNLSKDSIKLIILLALLVTIVMILFHYNTIQEGFIPDYAIEPFENTFLCEDGDCAANKNCELEQ